MKSCNSSELLQHISFPTVFLNRKTKPTYCANVEYEYHLPTEVKTEIHYQNTYSELSVHYLNNSLVIALGSAISDLNPSVL